ncbi:MAG: hypothetical protein VW667_05985 [Candidatus Neomarinimicrobiota bacterium]
MDDVLTDSVNLFSPLSSQKNVGDFSLYWITYFEKKLLKTVFEKTTTLKRILL